MSVGNLLYFWPLTFWILIPNFIKYDFTNDVTTICKKPDSLVHVLECVHLDRFNLFCRVDCYFFQWVTISCYLGLKKIWLHTIGIVQLDSCELVLFRELYLRVGDLWNSKVAQIPFTLGSSLIKSLKLFLVRVFLKRWEAEFPCYRQLLSVCQDEPQLSDSI